MSRIKFYHQDVCHKVFKHGMRLGDVLEIYPAIGRKKTITLNRVCYKMKTVPGLQQVGHQACELDLPSMSHDQYHLELQLIHSEKESRLGEDSRFFLRSKGSLPFRINGVYAFECFLERGDVLEFGYHKIRMMKKVHPNKILAEDNILEEKMVKSNISVLIEGETGTGKTHLARKIHEESGRSGRFVHLNLSSFSQNLIESELFGHKKGAFTGAISDKCGAIEEAHYGTLFLDEIDSLSLELQTKLLLFLDNGVYRKVGGDGERKSEVRIIFASGSNLKKLVDDHLMRKDFYYRIISGLKINLIPLREDPEKIKKICQQFALDQNLYISETLIDFYSKQFWPGNIRQLIGHLNKKVLLEEGDKMIWSECDAELDKSSLEHFKDHPPEEVISLEEFKKQYVKKVYRKYDGHIRDTARALKLAPNTVRSMVKKVA